MRPTLSTVWAGVLHNASLTYPAENQAAAAGPSTPAVSTGGRTDFFGWPAGNRRSVRRPPNRPELLK